MKTYKISNPELIPLCPLCDQPISPASELAVVICNTYHVKGVAHVECADDSEE